jgi:hypothetical protein
MTADRHGRLGEVVALCLDSLFPGIALLMPWLADIVPELQRLGWRVRRNGAQAQGNRDRKARKNSKRHLPFLRLLITEKS